MQKNQQSDVRISDYYADWEEHEALIRDQAMGDPVFSDEDDIDDLHNEVEALAREVAQLRSKLKGLDIGEKPQ